MAGLSGAGRFSHYREGALDVDGISRLDPVGEADGYRLLSLLDLLGWRVLVTCDRAQAGGVLVQAWQGETVIERQGRSVAGVAYPLLCEALGLARVPDVYLGHEKRPS